MRQSRLGAAVESGVFLLFRYKAAAALRWLAAKMGRELLALPAVKTAYIGFAVTVAAMIWVKATGERWADYGLKPLRRIWPTLGAGLLVTIFYLAYAVVAEPIVDNLVAEQFGGHPEQAARQFAEVSGNLWLYLFTLPFIWLFGAFGEEFFYRGFLMTKLSRVFGRGNVGWAVALLLQAAAFGFAHSYQGPIGMIGTGIVGLIYGGATLLYGRNLWPAIIAHGTVDTLGFTLLYLGMLKVS